MAQANNKTRPTDDRVEDFLNSVEHAGRREDSFEMLEIMTRLSGHQPVLWGSIVGFGQYHYKYDSGREGDMFLTGFSPRKTALTAYIMGGFTAYDDLMSRLGKYKIGKSCLYITRLSNVDRSVLEDLIGQSLTYMRDKYGVD
jgi:hypothetical protein